MNESFSFWNNWEMWIDAVIVSMISAAALSYLGVWVVLKRVVYVPLALSQVSSVGVVTAFLLAGWLHGETDCHSFAYLWSNPVLYSILFALLTAFYFARTGINSDNAVVIVYLISAAIVLILGGFIRQDMHDIQSVLFGSAVLVEHVQIYYVGIAVLLITVIHFLLYKKFLFVSFDPDTAGASGISVFRCEVILYSTFAIMISIVTRAIGALPAFGLMVLPGLTGLRLGKSMISAFIISMAAGVISASLGYYLSFSKELPAGASMVGLAGLIFIATYFIRNNSFMKKKKRLYI